MFKVGDKVRCVKGNWLENVGADNVGTVKRVKKNIIRDNLSVEWDNKPRNKYGNEVGHNCNGVAKMLYGYYVNEKDCVLAKNSNTIKYR